MIRCVAILILGLSLGGCGVGMPPPTKQKVSVTDIAGTWQYSGMFPGDSGRITFDTNGTFTLVLSYKRAGTAFTNAGTWSLTSDAHLDLSPFWSSSILPQASIDRHESVRWWVTSWYTKGVAPFGGDSLDPDLWALLGRVGR